MAIELGKVGALSSGALNGKSLKEAWLNGNKVYPSITPRNYFFTLMPFDPEFTPYFEFEVKVFGGKDNTLVYDSGILNGVDYNGALLFKLNMTDNYVKRILVELKQYGSYIAFPFISARFGWIDEQTSATKIAAGYYNSSADLYLSAGVADGDSSWDQFVEPGGTITDVNILINYIPIDYTGYELYDTWQRMSPAPGFTEQRFT